MALNQVCTQQTIRILNRRPILSRSKRSLLSDVDTPYLQVALSLQYVERAFYQQGLQKFSSQDFANAGFAPWVRGRFAQIATHEATHVNKTTTFLGDAAFPPCTYEL